MDPSASAFLSISPVSSRAFEPAGSPPGSPIVAPWQSAARTDVLFVAVVMVVIINVPPRTFPVNGFQANRMSLCRGIFDSDDSRQSTAWRVPPVFMQCQSSTKKAIGITSKQSTFDVYRRRGEGVRWVHVNACNVGASGRLASRDLEMSNV